MKYIDADKLIAEIERQRRPYLEREEYDFGWNCALDKVILILESAKPAEDLEKEFERIWDNELSGRCDTEAALLVARHFAEWQKEQMMKGAVEGKIVSYPARNDVEMQADEFKEATANFKHGQKVKVIIVKEDEK